METVKARSMEQLAVHGLWKTKEGPVGDLWRPWKGRFEFYAW